MDARTARGPNFDPESQQRYDEVFGERARLERTTSVGTQILEIPDGDRARALEDFERMSPENVRVSETPRGELRTGTLPNGVRVTVRGSKDGRPTIEIANYDESGDFVKGSAVEIRYGKRD